MNSAILSANTDPYEKGNMRGPYHHLHLSNIKMKIKVAILCLSTLFFLVQCRPKNSGNTTGQEQSRGKDKDTVKEARLHSLTYLLLSPSEILSEIFSKNSVLNPQLVNDRRNAGKYLDVKHQALNLGVYIADFAYLNLNESKTNILDYFKIIRDLAQKNNIYGCFDEGFFSRVQDNLNHNDSIVAISQEIYYHMSDNLENANRQNVYALIASGALIESIYLSVMNVSSYPEYQELAQRIFEQKPLFESFYSFISLYKDDPEVATVLIHLDELKNILNDSPLQKTKMVVTKNKNHHLSVKGGEDILVTENVFKKFKENVMKTRADMISISTK
jgi:hypothetical protein